MVCLTDATLCIQNSTTNQQIISGHLATSTALNVPFHAILPSTDVYYFSDIGDNDVFYMDANGYLQRRVSPNFACRRLVEYFPGVAVASFMNNYFYMFDLTNFTDPIAAIIAGTGVSAVVSSFFSPLTALSSDNSFRRTMEMDPRYNTPSSMSMRWRLTRTPVAFTSLTV